VARVTAASSAAKTFPSRLGLAKEKRMLKTFAAASLVAALALSCSAALAQSDSTSAPMPDKTMSDKTMAPKKPMMKHHAIHKKPTMAKTMHSDTMQPKM
jgi:hypothetical protein